jgi:hypothetical protein
MASALAARERQQTSAWPVRDNVLKPAQEAGQASVTQFGYVERRANAQTPVSIPGVIGQLISSGNWRWIPSPVSIAGDRFNLPHELEKLMWPGDSSVTRYSHPKAKAAGVEGKFERSYELNRVCLTNIGCHS